MAYNSGGQAESQVPNGEGAEAVDTEDAGREGVGTEDVTDAAAPGDTSSAVDATDAADTSSAVDATDRTDGAGTGGSRPDWRVWLKPELLLAVELAALSALAFGRPVLDGFGREPVPFVARGGTAADVVWFGVLVLLVPALAVTLVGVASRLAGGQVRRLVHAALVAVLGGLGAWWIAFQHTSLSNSGVRLFAAAAVVALGLGWLRWWKRTEDGTATFLRYAGIAPVVLLLQFLFTSQTGSWAFQTEAVDPEIRDQISADLGDDPPPVVMVVLDAMPTTTLLDGTGEIDSELFPNFAQLAEDGTWYRNHSTVSLYTSEAVPAIATGRYLDDSDWPANEPENIFALLGGRYDMHAEEQVTSLCTDCQTSRRGPSGLRPLLDDARHFWTKTVSREQVEVNQFQLGDSLGPGRMDEAMALVDQVGPGDGEDPPFYFYHLELPHGPWYYTADGTTYEPAQDPPLGTFFLNWGSSGSKVGYQRHVLQTQATDRMLGALFDRLRDEGIYDDALVVVTADHGEAFLPNDSGRGLSEQNQHHVAWVPLMIKEPGQTEGGTNDDNLMSIDILPTMASILGVEVPWEVDGLPASQVRGRRDPDQKVVIDHEYNIVRAADGETRVPVDGKSGFEKVLDESAVDGTGPDAVWQRTEHGELLRQPVDELDVGEPAASTLGDDVNLRMTAPKSLDGIDLAKPLPIEILGETALEPGTVVAYGLDDRIAAVTEVEPAPDRNWAHALLLPELFFEGDNELTAFVVEGPPGDETLHPLDVRF